MEFEGQYLTYEEYRDLGGTLDLTPFNLLEFQARRKIDIRTFNRLINLEKKDIPKEVKICEFEIINDLDNYTNLSKNIAEKSNIKSENTDGYSVSYVGTSEISEIVKSKSNEINDIISNYLLGVIVNGEHIMYCGVK